jgi:hypothetical protein
VNFADYADRVDDEIAGGSDDRWYDLHPTETESDGLYEQPAGVPESVS